MSKSVNILIVTVFALLIIAVVWVGSWFVRASAIERQVRKQISDIKAKGQPISYKDLRMRFSSVSSQRNAAVIYERLFKQYQNDLNNDDVALYDLTIPIYRQKNPPSKTEVRKALKKYQNIFPILKEAVAKPECSFVYMWPMQQAGSISYTKNLRHLQKIVCNQAILNVENGNINAAMDNIELAFMMSESLDQDPMLINQLTRWSMIDNASRALGIVVSKNTPDESSMKALYDVLVKIDLYAGYKAAWIGERAMGISHYDDILNHIKPARVRSIVPHTGFFKRTVIYPDELYYLNYMNICIDAVGIPYRDLKKSHVKMPKPPKHNTISDLLIPSFGSPWQQYDKAIAELRGNQILLALENYKSKYGKYPSTLGDLRSKLDWEISADPFSGADFIYKQKGKGFVLYSLGVNLKDDGGVTQTASPNAHDIVWQMDK